MSLLCKFSLVAQRLKCLPPMQETWVRSLVREDPLAKEMATNSSILAWRIPWTEDLVGYSPQGRKELGTTEQLHFPADSDSKESACNAGDLGSIPESGRSAREGISYPLLYSCLENSMDRGALTVHGAETSQTWLND